MLKSISTDAHRISTFASVDYAVAVFRCTARRVVTESSRQTLGSVISWNKSCVADTLVSNTLRVGSAAPVVQLTTRFADSSQSTGKTIVLRHIASLTSAKSGNTVAPLNDVTTVALLVAFAIVDSNQYAAGSVARWVVAFDTLTLTLSAGAVGHCIAAVSAAAARMLCYFTSDASGAVVYGHEARDTATDAIYALTI